MGRKLLGDSGITFLNPCVLYVSIIIAETAHSFEEGAGCQTEQGHQLFP